MTGRTAPKCGTHLAPPVRAWTFSRQGPPARRNLSAEQFAQLEHVVVSLRGGFVTPVDHALAALGRIVARSDFVALVPRQLVRDRAGELKIVECPFPAPGFEVGMVWHERNHGHQGQRRVREVLVELVAGRQGLKGAAGKRRPAASRGGTDT